MTSSALAPPSAPSTTDSSFPSPSPEALKASASPISAAPSSAEQQPSSSCLFHSRQWRPTLEFCINFLRKSNLFQTPFSLRRATCSCPSLSPKSNRSLLPPPSFSPQAAVSSLPPSCGPVLPFLTRLIQRNPESEQARRFVFAFSGLVHGREITPNQDDSAPINTPPAPAITIAEGQEEQVPEIPQPVETPLVSQTIEIQLEEAYIGVFISKGGFTSLLSPLRQQIHVHCGAYLPSSASLPITISAPSQETIDQVAQALRAQASATVLSRQRHQANLRAWAEVTRKRAEARRNRVLTATQSEHRFLSRLENAKSHVSQGNLKMIATSHYQRSVTGSNSSREIVSRQKRKMNPEEKRLLHDLSREKGLCCSQCSVGFQREISASACSHHPGYMVGGQHWGRGKAGKTEGRWTCCGVIGADAAPCTQGKHAWQVKESKEEKEGKERDKGKVGKRRANAKISADFAL